MIFIPIYFAIALVFSIANIHGKHCGWKHQLEIGWNEILTDLFLGLFWPVGVPAMVLDIRLALRQDKRGATMGKKVAILLAAGLLFFCASQAEACRHCGRSAQHCVYRQHVVHRQAIVQHQYISYFVGQPIRVESIIQKTIQSDPEYQAFQQYKAFVRQQHAQPAPQQDGDVPAEPRPADTLVSLLKTKCGSCHTGVNPPKGILLDGTAPLTDKLRVDSSREVMNGTMPPPDKRPPLTDAEYTGVLEEIITSKNEGE